MRTPSRDDSVTTSAPATPSCRACGQALTAVVGRQAYCSAACRQRAYRASRQVQPAPQTVTTRPRRFDGVYQCPDCEARYLGQQRCEDGNTFCTRLGVDGPCPCCEEMITLDELLTALTP